MQPPREDDAAEAFEDPPPTETWNEGSLTGRVAGATTLALGSLGGISVLRLASQMALSYLLAREYFGVIALVRVFLMGLRQFSHVGIHGSLLYHRRGNDPLFLHSAWTLQIVRGFVIWLGACALAWPASVFYSANDERAVALLWLLPVCGLEGLLAGFQTVRTVGKERVLDLKLPLVLDWASLVASISVTLAWAFLAQPDPGVWPLAAGPLAGGLVKLVLGHVLFPDRQLRPRWDPSAIRDLFGFGKWVFAGTITAFLAQQFHVLYLGRAAPLAVVGVYQLAWNFVVQSSKPLTMLSNRILIPLFAERGRTGRAEHLVSVHTALDRYLPACLAVIVSSGLLAPALFGYLYDEQFIEGGRIGLYLAVVVWFMTLQHAPRSALLSLGLSRGVFFLTLTNAVVTVLACFAGYALGGRTDLPLGGIKGLMLGNALGNAAGAFVGARITRGLDIPLGRSMLAHTLAFVGLILGGALLGHLAVWPGGLSERAASLVATLVVALPLGALLWRRTLRDFWLERRSARA